MTLKAIPRTAVDRSLKLARVPADTLLGIAGLRADVGAAKLGVDRVDATLRATAATVLGDRDLQQDADRRREAADERERAARLRSEAQSRSETARDRAEAREEQAADRREQAAEQAGKKRQSAEKRSQAVKGQATKAAKQRKSAAEKKAAQEKQAVQEQAKRGRLDQLETKEEALGEKEAALTARDEAERLGDAAAAAKAERKSGS